MSFPQIFKWTGLSTAYFVNKSRVCPYSVHIQWKVIGQTLGKGWTKFGLVCPESGFGHPESGQTLHIGWCHWTEPAPKSPHSGQILYFCWSWTKFGQTLDKVRIKSGLLCLESGLGVQPPIVHQHLKSIADDSCLRSIRSIGQKRGRI